MFQLQKQDPAQFIRIYGRPMKINLEKSVALAAEGPQSMYDCVYIYFSYNIVQT